MSGWDDPAFFGERWADDYDGEPAPEPAAEVAFLADLAGDGRVLELAIGTGRVAVQLAVRDRPDGHPGGPSPGRALRRLAPPSVRSRQQRPHLRLPPGLIRPSPCAGW